jgi:hypothetical protein
VTVANRDGGTTMFEHLFQSGWYDRTLAIDGTERIGGWYGQRDRSRGVRTMSGRPARPDRLATFDWDGTPGIGIFEFALTRSRSYSYRPTLAG